MKRNFRILSKFVSFYFLKIFYFFFYKSNYRLIPTLDEFNKLKYDYSYNTRRLVLRKNKNKFDKIFIDSTHSETDLCILGRNFNTNKSSINLEGHRSGYTALYSLLFNQLKDKKCILAEIGIEKNGSTKMWRKYFTKALIECFEKDVNKINFAKKQKLKKTNYSYIDVGSPTIIKEAFKNTKKKYDIIIDDSTHEFDHQINIIKNVNKFLKKNGILIIEDIYRFRKKYSEDKYFNALKNIRNIFSKITFVETIHANNFTSNWKCEKILLLIKK